MYAIFVSDFKENTLSLKDMKVWWDTRKVNGGNHEEGFWHLITKLDYQNGERLLDPRRAERLGWCRPTIVNVNDDHVKEWEYEEGNGKIRIYLWLEDFDYIVILEKKEKSWGTVAFLICAPRSAALVAALTGMMHDQHGITLVTESHNELQKTVEVGV